MSPQWHRVAGSIVVWFVVFLNALAHNFSSLVVVSRPWTGPKRNQARQMTMDARDKEIIITYRPNNAQQQSYRIVTYRIGAAEQEKVNGLV